MRGTGTTAKEASATDRGSGKSIDVAAIRRRGIRNTGQGCIDHDACRSGIDRHMTWLLREYLPGRACHE
ncbi:MAG: hypothetical protein JEY79_01920 [Pseudodesulfovibrio sp.]|nr:hypothetical protein [Pseudodesulfovibrio sp.]